MSDALRPDLRPTSLTDLCAALAAGAVHALDVPSLADVASPDAVIVTGITHDSRSVLPGDLYLALPGRTTHGAVFVDQAVAAGAVAVVTDTAGARLIGNAPVPVLVVADPRRISGPISAAVYAWPARSLQLLGVTGTNGKTTVAAMVESGLRAAGLRAGAIGTTGVHLDAERRPLPRTTPEAADLQAILGRMRDRGTQAVVMEASSIAVREHRLDGFRFDVMGFTNLTQDHLDYHSGMEDYFASKAQLFDERHSSIGVVGIDDAYGRRLARQATVPVLTWSVHDTQADWHAARVESSVTGSEVDVLGPRGERTWLKVPLPGEYNVANALCALGILRTAGIGADAAARGIAAVHVPGRMEVVPAPVGALRAVVGIVDYAHTPDAITRAVGAVRAQGTGRVIVVIGAGGDRDPGKRPLMGRAAARLADVLIVTDDNPRSEEPSIIRAAVLRGALDEASRCAVIEQGGRAEAIGRAVDLAGDGDVVLVLGKGHETGQEVAGVVTPFDDVAVLTRALRERT